MDDFLSLGEIFSFNTNIFETNIINLAFNLKFVKSFY